jgi:nucleoside-diphosphate-sugar epimerase
MQNVLAHWDQILEHGIYPVPYAAKTRLSLVDLEDVAEAATVVLAEPGHTGATYELVGGEAMTQVEVAAVLSQQLGHPVHAEVVPLDAWERRARAAGLGDYQVKTLIEMFRYYERHGFWGNPRVLGWLLRRTPTTFAAFVERVAQKRLNLGSLSKRRSRCSQS